MVPELKLEGVRFRVHRGGDLRASGEAEVATLRRDSTELRAKDLAAVLTRSASPLRITAPAGEGVLSSRAFSAQGGVTIARGSDVARTERARYEPGPRGGQVVGDDPITVDGPSYRLVGKGFTLDPATTELAIRGGARLVAGGGERR